MAGTDVAGNGKVGLQRELGLLSAISMIVAVMIGSGIFVSPAQALKRSGSIGLSLIVWVVCGFLSLLGALVFAELSAVVPRSGAEYAYLVEAFSPLHKYFGQLPSFLCAWIFVFVLRPAEIAVITLTCAEYIIQPFSEYMIGYDIDMEQMKKIIALLALGLMTYINVTSVKVYVKVQNVFTVCKLIACFIVIIGGIWWLGSGRTELLQRPFENTTSSPAEIALAFYSGLWAYDGWTSATLVTEEVQHPEINILRSILIAVPTVTALYVAMNVMYMAVLTVDQLISTKAVAVLWGSMVLPSWLRFAIPLGVAFSTFGCGLSVQFGVSRLCYVAGREGHIPTFFSFIHMTRMTPAAAVIFQCSLTVIMIAVGSVNELIEFASFLTWIFYGLAMVALIIMRKTKPHIHRPYAVPIFIPVLVLFISIFLVIAPIVEKPSLQYLFVLLFMLCGVLVYHEYVYKKKRSQFMKKLTHLVQVLFLVIAPDEADEEQEGGQTQFLKE